MGNLFKVLNQIFDIITQLFEFVWKLIQDLIYIITLLPKLVVKIPDLLNAFMPGACVSILLVLVSVTVIYRIMGRD